jgi:hypothetical protein
MGNARRPAGIAIIAPLFAAHGGDGWCGRKLGMMLFQDLAILRGVGRDRGGLQQDPTSGGLLLRPSHSLRLDRSARYRPWTARSRSMVQGLIFPVSGGPYFAGKR